MDCGFMTLFDYVQKPSSGRDAMQAPRLLGSTAPSATVLIRVMVGWVFLSEGVQKFLFPAALGAGRFAKIGIPAPQFFAPFVGIVEIVCGALLIVGLVTRLASIPLLIDILVAIATTKIPMLSKSGFWAMMHEARTDFCMLLGLIFLLIAGSGTLSFDERLSTKR
jgi:uncharacterized membrane protein YphA (DoxX/SURF4 family)